MTDIFFVIAILSLLALVVGIIKPQAVKMPSRKIVVIVYPVLFFLFLGLGAELSSDKGNESGKSQEPTVASSQQPQTDNQSDKKKEETAQQKTEPLCKSDYPTALAAFSDLSDYNTDNNTLEIVSESPLRIRLSDLALPNDHPDVKEMLAKRAVIYGVYRSFIHTNKDEVTITSYLIDMNTKKRLSGSPEYSIKITKKQALDIIKKYLPVHEYTDLIAKDGYGCFFSDDFNQLRFDDKNKNAIFNKFFNDLISANK